MSLLPASAAAATLRVFSQSNIKAFGTNRFSQPSQYVDIFYIPFAFNNNTQWLVCTAYTSLGVYILGYSRQKNKKTTFVSYVK